MTSTLEIRPGSVDHLDLAILERALAKKRGKTARLTASMVTESRFLATLLRLYY